MNMEREVQSEEWWKSKKCPDLGVTILEVGTLNEAISCMKCLGSECAYWRSTGRINGKNQGICTKS